MFELGQIEPTEKKKNVPLWRRALRWVGIGGLAVAIAFGGVAMGNFAQTKGRDYRTDASTEVHKRLGQAFAHLGDQTQPVTRAPIGGTIYIHNKYIKTETCHGFTSNVFWDLESHVVHHYSMFTNWFSAGTYEANEVFVIPAYLPPGRYHIIKKTVSICNGLEHYTTNFDIVVEFYKPTKP